ncbi:hypothetical protein CHI12_11825 [Terribacillus saccharophilus]|uniref:Uncharacterized protein n=1 Tax=Terribacillus saccharophilus TaxID=361277 RepID=A0A268HBV8_9BACI|nr:hypothetical protein CHI12_11825 [Terribacillus saccharophilus]
MEQLLYFLIGFLLWPFLEKCRDELFSYILDRVKKKLSAKSKISKKRKKKHKSKKRKHNKGR